MRATCGVISGRSATTSPVAGSTKRRTAARAPSPRPRSRTSRYSKAGVMIRSYPQRSNSTRSASAMDRRRAAASGRKSRTPTGRRMGDFEGTATEDSRRIRLKDDLFGALDMRELADGLERGGVELGGDLPHHEGAAVARDVQARHVDAALAEERADGADDAGAIDVAQEQEAALERGVDGGVVELDQARLGVVADLEDRRRHHARPRRALRPQGEERLE